jgi:hypothetical protein
MRVLGIALALWLLATPSLAEGVVTGMPSGLADNLKQFWRAFMAEFYGPYDKAKKCWISNTSDGQYCMRPHTLQTIMQDGKKRLFLSAAGSIDKPGEPNDCHACAGSIGYFVLDATGEKLSVIARSKPYLDDGSYGRATPEDRINVRQIGPDENYGWVAEGFWMGQGIEVENFQVFGVIGDQVRSLGSVSKSYSDQGNCDENGKLITSGEPCSEFRFEATFDTSKPDRFSPIILRSTGLLNGQMFEQTFTSTFDESQFLYQRPPGLPEQAGN